MRVTFIHQKKILQFHNKANEKPQEIVSVHIFSLFLAVIVLSWTGINQWNTDPDFLYKGMLPLIIALCVLSGYLIFLIYGYFKMMKWDKEFLLVDFDNKQIKSPGHTYEIHYPKIEYYSKKVSFGKKFWEKQVEYYLTIAKNVELRLDTKNFSKVAEFFKDKKVLIPQLPSIIGEPLEK